MKRIMITAVVFSIFSSTIWAQENIQNRQQKDKNKSEMQQDDLNNNKKVKKDSTKKDTTRKTNKKKRTSDEKSRRMDNYESTKQQSGTPAEQRHMDTTINNHR